MALLEVFIPTYNRPVEFHKCLKSLENALLYLASGDRAAIGVAINDNSTNYIERYEKIIEDFKIRLGQLGVSYFDYRRTGFDVGAVNNIASGIYSAKAEYVWCLPDDDLARFDSLSVLILVIKQYRPCFISAAWSNKSMINYDSDANGDDDGHENKVLDAIGDGAKVSNFLAKNVVQLQEYVYPTRVVKRFLAEKKNHSLLNDLLPALFALVSLREDGLFVRLERSVGIYRDGESNSEWRHLWFRIALIDWPQLCEKLFNRGWLSADEYRLAAGVFRTIFVSLSTRPLRLLGLNRRYQLNPFLLIKYHRSAFFNTLLLMPFSISMAIFKRLKKII